MRAGPVRGDFLEELGPAGLCRKGRIWSAGIAGEGSPVRGSTTGRGRSRNQPRSAPLQKAYFGGPVTVACLVSFSKGVCGLQDAHFRHYFLENLWDDSVQTFRVKFLVALAQCGPPSGSISLPPTRSSTATQRTWSTGILCSGSKRRRPHTPTSHLRKKLKNEKRS